MSLLLGPLIPFSSSELTYLAEVNVYADDILIFWD